MKNKHKTLTRPIQPAPAAAVPFPGDQPEAISAAAPQGQLRRVPASEALPPRRRPSPLRSRTGAIPGRSAQPGRPYHAYDNGSGGTGFGGSSQGGPGGSGYGGPGGPGGPAGPGHGGSSHGGSGHGGHGGPGRRDPRQRRRHRGLKITLVVLLILILGLVGSAYLLWNKALDNVNIVSPTDAQMTIPSEYNLPTESLSNPVPEEKGVINVLLLGVDARDKEELQTNSDSMMILTIDQDKKKIKLTSLQRDMLVWMPGHSEPAKLNSANSYGGPALALRVVNDTFRLNIENYVIVNMRGMEELVDVAGGVNINVDKDEVWYTNQMIIYQNAIYPTTRRSPELKGPGMQLLDGRQAVAYGRIRKGDSDYARMGRQRVIIQALLDRFMQAGIGTKTSMITKGLGFITTNFSKTQLTTFGLSTVPLMNGKIEQLQIPINGYFVEDPEPVWVNRCDFNGMIPLLQQFIYGRTYPFDPVKKIPGAPNSGTKVTTAPTTKATTKATTTASSATTTRAASSSATTKATTDSTSTQSTSSGTASESSGPKHTTTTAEATTTTATTARPAASSAPAA